MSALNITNQIHFRNLRGDIFGGLTAAIISLPMALAFGVASGAGPEAGLWGAVCVGFFAALFGGTPTLISEPTGPMTVVMTAVVANMQATNPENGLAMAFTVVMLAGVFQILFGALRLGKYVTLMPYNVISGFMSGIGLILIILQISPFLGQANPKGGVMGVITNLPDLLSKTNPIETILGVLTVAIIFLTPVRLKNICPPQLLALVVGTVVSLVFFGDVDIRRIDEIAMGLPQFTLPTFSLDQINTMVIDGIVLGMLGCIDSLLTSVIADSLTESQHDSDKELIGQGIGNIVSGLCSGLPGAGATMGTVVNIQTGGRTALSGLTRAGILFIAVMGAGALTRQIPLAVLAGIALKVGLDIIDWKFLRRAHKLSIRTACIMYGVMLLTVFVDLIMAVGLGVFFANLLTIKRLADIQAGRVRAIDTPTGEILDDPEAKRLLRAAKGKILLLHLGGPMSFGAAKAITQRQSVLDNYEMLLIDLTDVPLLGVTATLALEKVVGVAYEKAVDVFVVGAEGKVQKRLQRFNILDRIPHEHLTKTRVEALRIALERLRVNHPELAEETSTPKVESTVDSLDSEKSEEPAIAKVGKE
ncbi:MAG: SulP family inorganic anion transporter [Cyanobacteria bacterium P01_E01_bin.42]